MGFPRPYGRYILEDRLAMGGMAEIFRARTATTGFEKRVCIKRVLPHLSAEDDFVTMFRDEAKTAARLQHANVVQVFDFGEIVDDHDDSKSTLFLAMELIEGHDLRKLADASRKKGIPFSVGEVTQIGIEMCRGLHHAHTLRDESGALLGVVHRDISPHNVLVSKQGEVKITDFGIAKAAERATHTSTGIVKGKVAYMSPEQAEGKPFDHRLDQWATGVVLWELLCGERLFRGENDATILRKVLNVEVPAPTSLRTDVPRELEQIVLRALSGEPEQRFADMRQMELALSRFLFSGAIDPADAEVRTAYARIMEGMVSAPRKTNIMPAVEPAPAPPAPTVILRDEQRHVEEAPRVPRLSMATDESQVFVSSAKLPAAPRGSILPASAVEPAPPTELVDGDVAADAAAAAAAILEAQARARAAPSIAVGAANDTLELPSLIASVPTTPERSRSQRPAAGPITMIADGDLAAAARAIGDNAAIAADTTIADDDLDGTPATRTLVPAQELSSTTAPAAIVVKAPTGTSATEGTTRDELLPKSRAPLFAAGGLGVGAILAVIGLAFSGTAPPETTTATTTTAPATTTTTNVREKAPEPTTTTTPPTPAAVVEAPAPVEAPTEAVPPPPEPAAIVTPPPPTVSSTPTPTPAATPAPKAATKPSSSSSSSSSSSKKVETADEEPAPRGTPGSVYVDVPGGWATVSIGKKVYGETPVTLTLPAGKYTVTLTSGDGAKKKNVPLVVVAGKKAQIREAL